MATIVWKFCTGSIQQGGAYKTAVCICIKTRWDYFTSPHHTTKLWKLQAIFSLEAPSPYMVVLSIMM